MSSQPAPFLGFEEPKNDINAYTWKERVLALCNDHPNKWAKFGPYLSSHSAANAASRIRNIDIENRGKIFSLAEANGKDYYLFVKVTPNGV